MIGPTLTPGLSLPAVLVVSVGVGVGIDVDHFAIARYNTGRWSALRSCVRDPTIVFVGQDKIFEPGEVGPLHRLLSHVFVGGVAVLAIAAVSIPWALVVLAAVYTHLLADLVWDVFRNGGYPNHAPAMLDESGDA